MPISTVGKPRNNQAGFSYVMLLATIVVMGIVVEVGTTLSSQVKRAEQEAELLYRGMAYRNAIRSYYRANGAYPRALEDLVGDNRRAVKKRHLRVLYPDPMMPYDSKQIGWKVIRDAGGGIKGVASTSTLEPRKKANFPKGLEKFEAAANYSQWVFEYIPETPSIPVVPPPSGLPVGPPVRTTN